MKIILISGKAEAGKTTAAKFLKEELESRGERVAITPYGRLVKDLCNMLYGWNGQKDEAGRQLLQHFGTGVIRKQAPNYWVDHIIDLSFMLYDEFDTFIIDDCRFPNEVERWKYFTDFIKNDKDYSSRSYDIYWLRIERPRYENHLTPEQRQHPSEIALDGYEMPRGSWMEGIYVKNDAGLMAFRDTVIEAFNYLESYNKLENRLTMTPDDMSHLILAPEDFKKSIGFEDKKNNHDGKISFEEKYL